MIFSPSNILALLSAHPYSVLLPLAIAEGPLVTIASGVLVASSQLSFWPVLAIVVVGDLVGDSALYALGRWGGIRMATRWASQRTIARAIDFQDQFRRKADQVLVTGKLTHAVGAPVLIAAGIVRMSFGRFLTVNFLATLPKSLALICLGYVFHSGYAAIDQNMTYYIVVLLIAGLILLYLLLSR
ncbi:VTT domain-containing protein [Mesorhizobium sp. AR07]|uniref:DedA family protein n=1 Tax=Mesorhizobium sp. AR07 TaxID=2865838 RepID=UPI00215F07C8|nr:VTT domain-containing protein [Mesorhizobium sp. AR07]UVK43986.1 VTT domain-containing protein [Mesorhizobium sp. AR07]